MRERAGVRWPRGSGPALVLVSFFAFILAEVSLLVWVSTQIGWWTLGLLMVSTVLGAYLLQREWRKAWTQLSDSVKTGSLPPGRTADAVLVLLGGFMLIMPGFITDVVGLLLLLPFTRPGVRSVLGWWAGRIISSAPSTPGGTVIKGEVIDQDGNTSGSDPAEGRIVFPAISPDAQEPEGS